VVLAGRVEDTLHLLVLTLGPILVGGATVVSDGPEDGAEGQHDDGLLVDDVDLIADGGDGDTGAGGEDGGLGRQIAAGQRVED
jgi:hypothetical protein